MFKDIVTVPFHHGPVELLPPTSRDRKPVLAGRAQCRHRRRLLKIALQIRVRPEFGELFGHQSRISTVKSLPGYTVPTESTDRLTKEPPIRGPIVFPSAAADVVMPVAIVR